MREAGDWLATLCSTTISLRILSTTHALQKYEIAMLLSLWSHGKRGKLEVNNIGVSAREAEHLSPLAYALSGRLQQNGTSSYFEPVQLVFFWYDSAH